MKCAILFGKAAALAAVFTGFAIAGAVSAQVFVVRSAHVEKRYATITPTAVPLSREPINELGRGELIRHLQSEQGFAVRPLPIAVITLHANGPMDPSGRQYVHLLDTKGTSVTPGSRVAITAIRFHRNDIIFDLNGGPFHKHRFLSHVSLGVGNATTPLSQDSLTVPAGTRIILQFQSAIPNISGEQVQALLKPLIDFGSKSPAQAYAETLPPFLRKAIDEHRVLVGMDRDMVLYAKGEPTQRFRETDSKGQPIVTWVYGKVPHPVEFVRFVGPLVVRDDLARVGQPMIVRTANEMQGYWGNEPVPNPNVRVVELGDPSASDVSLDNAPRGAPTLRKPGEQLPGENSRTTPQMRPVRYPKDMQQPGDPGDSPPPTPGTAPQPAPAESPSGQQPGQAPGQP